MKYSSWVIILLLLLLGFIAEGQQITRAEYYWDVDPGIGMATPVVWSQTDELEEDFEIKLTTEEVGEGMHLFCMRFQNSEGDWSIASEVPVFIQKVEYEYAEQDITYVEVFWNDDPGIGMGKQIELDELDEIEQELNLTLTDRNLGLQLLGVRFKNSGGLWSQTNDMPVFIQKHNSNFKDQKLVAGEYFWDNETGAGKAIPIVITEKDTIIDTRDITTDYIEEGMHLLSMRFKNTAGNWSELSELPVFVQAQGYVYADQKVVEAEYYFDVDMGVGHSKRLDLQDSDMLQMTFYLDVATLDIGAHLGAVRFKNSAGEWGETQDVPFFVDPERPDIISYTYYFDVDSISKLFMNASTPADTLDEEVGIAITGLDLGLHQLYLQVNDASDRQSIFLMQEFEVEPNVSVDEELLSESIYCYWESGWIYVCANSNLSQIEVYDISGRLVAYIKPISDQSILYMPFKSVYLVKVGSEVFKIISM